MPDKIDIEAEMDRLHAVPPGDFVEARDALGARLKASGRSADAARVKASRKPNAPAWAVNQLRFAAPKILAALLAAGDRLRDKAGNRQEAMRARRDALAAARKKIEELLVAGGHAVTADLQRRVSSTLEAVVAHGSSPGRPAVGRLTQELSAPGFDEIAALGLLGAGVPRLRLVRSEKQPAHAPERKPDPKPPLPEAKREARRRRAARERDAKRARANLQAAEKSLEAARRKQELLETALSQAMRLERKLREEVAGARKALEEALRAVDSDSA